MAKQRELSIAFPSGGVSERHGFNKQAPFTTPDSNNIWPFQWETGRERGGVRPGIVYSGGSVSGAKNWCDANWVGNNSVAVVGSSGTSVYTGSSWDIRISESTSSNDVTSCATHLMSLYQAVGTTNHACVYVPLDESAGKADLVAAAEKGTAPKGCGLVSSWNDRLVLAGDIENPQILYMSAVGDPTDWDYSSPTGSAAWANSSSGTSGAISENITSLIHHNSDCLIVGCTDSMYAVRGNPAAGGYVYSLSNVIGPLQHSAWCKTDNDHTVIMTRSGLYSIRPGCGEPPVSMSSENLPSSLVGIDPGSGDSVSIGYDSRWRGIHIYANYSGGSKEYWFYDLQSKGFWPMSFLTHPDGSPDFESPSYRTVDLAINIKDSASPTKSGLHVISGSSSYQFDSDSTSEFIDSHIVYGPIPLGSAHTEGVLTELNAVLSEDSGDVAWSVFAAKSAQEAYALVKAGTPSFTGTKWDVQGFNYLQNPLVRGAAFYLKLEDDSGTASERRWCVEEILAKFRPAGKRRK